MSDVGVVREEQTQRRDLGEVGFRDSNSTETQIRECQSQSLSTALGKNCRWHMSQTRLNETLRDTLSQVAARYRNLNTILSSLVPKNTNPI